MFNHQELTPNDVRYVVERLPRDIRKILSKYPRLVMLGGGFIRASIAGEVPSDIDIFGDSKERLKLIAQDLVNERPGSKMHESKNAITVITPNRLPVQFITRWTFTDPNACCASFDFTVCQAVIWRAGTQNNASWCSTASKSFYVDLAGRRLVYTNPVRDEEAGGSMLRVIKYVKRGYSIQVTSLGDVIARLLGAVRDARENEMASGEAEHPVPHLSTGKIIAGLLREVDPLLVIDGFDIVDDHETDEPQ